MSVASKAAVRKKVRVRGGVEGRAPSSDRVPDQLQLGAQAPLAPRMYRIQDVLSEWKGIRPRIDDLGARDMTIALFDRPSRTPTVRIPTRRARRAVPLGGLRCMDIIKAVELMDAATTAGTVARGPKEGSYGGEW